MRIRTNPIRSCKSENVNSCKLNLMLTTDCGGKHDTKIHSHRRKKIRQIVLHSHM